MGKMEIPFVCESGKKRIKLLTWLRHKERLACCPYGTCDNTSFRKKTLERDLKRKQRKHCNEVSVTNIRVTYKIVKFFTHKWVVPLGHRCFEYLDNFEESSKVLYRISEIEK